MAEFVTPQFWVAVAEIILVNILLSGDNAGVIGAIGLRILLTFFAMSLLVYPWLRLVGAALLLWIGVKLVAEDDSGEHKVKASDRLLTAVGTIIVADLVMSLDNVVAVAAAAKGSLSLLVFGLVISIPIV